MKESTEQERNDAKAIIESIPEEKKQYFALHLSDLIQKSKIEGDANENKTIVEIATIAKQQFEE